jgi:hypothetical protein
MGKAPAPLRVVRMGTGGDPESVQAVASPFNSILDSRGIPTRSWIRVEFSANLHASCSYLGAPGVVWEERIRARADVRRFMLLAEKGVIPLTAAVYEVRGRCAQRRETGAGVESGDDGMPGCRNQWGGSGWADAIDVARFPEWNSVWGWNSSINLHAGDATGGARPSETNDMPILPHDFVGDADTDPCGATGSRSRGPISEAEGGTSTGPGGVASPMRPVRGGLST